MMDERLQEWLDGKLDRERLPGELQEDAAEWERILAEMRRSAPPGAPPGFAARVMAEIRAAKAEESLRPAGEPAAGRPRWLDWALRPRTIRVSPLTAAAAAAAVALAVLRPWTGGSGEAAEVWMQFSVRAPAARSVEVVGDFSGWQPAFALEDADGDGVWSGRAPLAPGVHQYMFVIDGSRWMTDPNAAAYSEDGFGQRNALVAVPDPARGT